VRRMLADIARDRDDAVRRYARELDKWESGEFRVGQDEIRKVERTLPETFKADFAYSLKQVSEFAKRQLETLKSFEAEIEPGIFIGQKMIPIARVGLLVGATAAAAGWIGVALGGWIADAWRARSARGRIWLAIAAALAPLPLLPWMLLTGNTTHALLLNVPISLAGSMWVGVGAATITDLVLPRMRGTASAAYLLVVTFVGLALGPYLIGQLSDAFGDLRQAMLAGLVASVAGALLLAIGARGLPEAERSLTDRARAAGETGV